jgi:hypothetical protein
MGISYSCHVLLLPDDDVALNLQRNLRSGSKSYPVPMGRKTKSEIKMYQEVLCCGIYGKINSCWISVSNHRNTQIYGQRMPVKSILDGSAQESCCTKPLMDVLRLMEQFWTQKSLQLEDLLNRPTPASVLVSRRSSNATLLATCEESRCLEVKPNVSC